MLGHLALPVTTPVWAGDKCAFTDSLHTQTHTHTLRPQTQQPPATESANTDLHAFSVPNGFSKTHTHTHTDGQIKIYFPTTENVHPHYQLLCCLSQQNIFNANKQKLTQHENGNSQRYTIYLK